MPIQVLLEILQGTRFQSSPWQLCCIVLLFLQLGFFVLKIGSKSDCRAHLIPHILPSVARGQFISIFFMAVFHLLENCHYVPTYSPFLQVKYTFRISSHDLHSNFFIIFVPSLCIISSSLNPA